MANEHLTPRDGVIQPGETAPDFELPTDVWGKSWRLSDALKQGDVVLSFFPFAFTGVCGTEMSCITKDLGTLGGKGTTVVGISADGGPSLAEWKKQLGLTQTLLSDNFRRVSKAYGLYWADHNVAWRGTVVIGKDGKVKWSQKREPKQAFSPQELLAHLS
ncbi:MAG TPA: redoxin domain-containing protein [Phycisphaerales bacterium]|nr:redoxin domain-containing protein [Phycisphaerales bacterium]